MGRANRRESRVAEPKIPRIHKKLRGPRRGHRRASEEAPRDPAGRADPGNSGAQSPSARAEEDASKGTGEGDRQRGLQMRGHIRERSPGHWAIVIDVRDPQTGKRKRRWHSFAGNKRQAQVECAKLIAEIKNGTALDPANVTLREYLERWLAHMATQVSPRSAENYREVVEHWIVPALGNVKLTKLQPEQIAHAYSDALTRGATRARACPPAP